MQLLHLSSPRDVTTIIYLLLSQAVLAWGLPVTQDGPLLGEIESRAPPAGAVLHTPSKRALSSTAVKAIGGGVVGLVLLALIIGLGSASVAILGSTEWREFRDRNKPKEDKGKAVEKGHGQKEEGPAVPAKDGLPTRSNSVATAATTASASSAGQQTVNTVDEEKAAALPPAPAPPRRSRLTFGLPPMDFNASWLTSGNKK